MTHDILRAKPDLVIFHAYQGTAEQWERFIQNIRRETCAEIMIRVAHIDAHEPAGFGPVQSDEVRMLRRIAQKYDIEMVDLRREWIDYLQKNHFQTSDMLRDQVHLNEKGSILMAALYERHFRPNTLDRSQWMNTVRRYNVLLRWRTTRATR